MNDSKLLGQGYRFYEQLYTVVEMNDYGGHELRALNAMTNVGLWLIWTNLGCELRALDAINNSRMWMTWDTLVRELKALDDMNNFGLWLT